MKVAALYDIHGNLPALEAVLAEVELAKPDLVVVGGDIASGPMPVETLERLRELGARVRFVRGNADRVLDFAVKDTGDPEVWPSRLWVAEQLGEEQLDFLQSLPLDEVVDLDGLGPARFCHGAPGSDVETITTLTSEERLKTLLAGVDEPTVVCGHTHVQFDRRAAGRRIVNAGSVGLPYESRPGAYWLVAGPDISLRRTPYDLEDAARRILATGYPKAERMAREIAIDDPSRPGKMAAIIEGVGEP
jgi:predicted phosphodiesterase